MLREETDATMKTGFGRKTTAPRLSSWWRCRVVMMRMLMMLMAGGGSRGFYFFFFGPSTTPMVMGFSSPTTRQRRNLSHRRLFPQSTTRHGRHCRRGSPRSTVVQPRGEARSSALSNSLIGTYDTWGNWAVLTGAASLAQFVGKSTKVGRLLGPPVTAMALTFTLATVGVLPPGGTPAARSLQLLSLQLATPLILLGADLRDALQRCGPMLVSFLVASTATLVACLAAWPLLGKALASALGKHDGLVIAAALMAKNIGGGLNYMAVCKSLQASDTAIAAGLCVDNIFALFYFPVTSILASGRPDFSLANTVVAKHNSTMEEEIAVSSQEESAISVENATMALSISAALLWIGERVGGSKGALPLCTLLTVLFASQAPYAWVSKIQLTAQTMGTVCLYLFFSTAGSPGLAIADSVRASILPLGLFLTMLYSIHGLILYGTHLLFRKRKWKAFQVQPLLCASSAAIGGPATAVALAEAFDWKSLYVPSLLVGNIGYAMATFLGLAYQALFK